MAFPEKEACRILPCPDPVCPEKPGEGLKCQVLETDEDPLDGGEVPDIVGNYYPEKEDELVGWGDCPSQNGLKPPLKIIFKKEV